MSERHCFVRPARKDDTERFVQWSNATANNLYDPAVANYPTTATLCCFNREGPLAYVPVQQPFMLEALAFRPESGAVERAQAMKALTQAVVTQAAVKGVGEIFFLCADEQTEAFAQRHGYERVPYALYRMKVAELEKPVVSSR